MDNEYDDYDPFALTLSLQPFRTRRQLPHPQEADEQPFPRLESSPLSDDPLSHPPPAITPQETTLIPPNNSLTTLQLLHPSTWAAPASAAASSSGSRSRRNRSNPKQAPGQERSETVPVPFPWATNMRATVHTLAYLQSQQINTITGSVNCKNCDETYEVSYDLEEKLNRIIFLVLNIKSNRAHDFWVKPTLPECAFCVSKNSARPVVARKKREINWLFLLLGETLGCLTLKQLRYFNKHSNNHRSGGKTFVLYYTYLGLCHQLCPDGRFVINSN